MQRMVRRCFTSTEEILRTLLLDKGERGKEVTLAALTSNIAVSSLIKMFKLVCNTFGKGNIH